MQKIELIKLRNIIPDPNQPRQTFRDEDIQELAASFDGSGPEQPIMVRQPRDGKYMIIAGEMRWRAAKLKGIAELPCLVRDMTDEKEVRLAQLKENLQRKDLPPLEIGVAYRKLMDEHGLTERAIAEQVGKSQSRVHEYANLATNLLDLLKNQIGEGTLNLSTTQAIEIAKIEVTEKQLEVAQIIKEKKIWHQHYLRDLVKRVNLAMKLYGNIPQKKPTKLKNGEPDTSLEAIAEGVLHVEEQKPSKVRRKRTYHEEVKHRIAQLDRVLSPWLAADISNPRQCLEVQQTLNDFKEVIDEYIKSLRTRRESLFSKGGEKRNNKTMKS